MYLIADRWRFEGSFSHHRDSRFRYSGSRMADDWSEVVAATLYYYVEDHMSIAGTISQSQMSTDYGYDYPSTLNEFRRDTNFGLSLTYHFAGIGGFNTNYSNPKAPGGP
jgi:hypothetical protein